MTTNTTARTPSKPRAATKRKARRPSVNYKPLQLMLTIGTFLATWLGTNWLARQEAAELATIYQPEPVVIAQTADDGTVTETVIELAPIPQVVVSSRSSK